MTRVRPLLFALTLAAAVSTACGSSGLTNATGPTPTHCQVSAINPTSSFGVSGGDGSITVNVARECSWSAASQAAWITITSGNSGQGDGTVTYHVATNADPVARRSSITIGDQQATIAQDAAPCQYAVSGLNDPLAASGGDVAVTVQTNAACSWTAASDASWVSVGPLSGSGNASVRVTASANAGPQRTAVVTVAATRLTVTQLGAPSAPPPTPTPTPTPTPPPPPPPPPTIDLSGRVSDVHGKCPLLAFNVQSHLVLTLASTQFAGGPCKNLENGTSVSVHGTVQSDGSVAALNVTFAKGGS